MTNQHSKSSRTIENDTMLDQMADEADEASPSTRRSAIRTLGKMGLGAAAFTTVSFLGTKPREALAQDSGGPSPIDVVNYALTLEYLEQFFYQVGTDSGIIPNDAMDVFELIQKHEESHVTVLKQVAKDLGGTPVEFERSDFDFTAGNAFSPFSDYSMFLTLSQGFEDTGVRAYKGQAPNLMGTAYLTPALQIHSLEARHAAQVRRLRSDMGVNVDPWIVLDDGTDGTALEAIYGAGDGFPAEENVTQAGVDLTMLGDYTMEEASAAFDEPLDMDTVTDIAEPFAKGDLDGDGMDAS